MDTREPRPLRIRANTGLVTIWALRVQTIFLGCVIVIQDSTGLIGRNNIAKLERLLNLHCNNLEVMIKELEFLECIHRIIWIVQNIIS